MLRNRLGLVDIPPAKPEGYSVEVYTVERAVDEWIEEREQDGINKSESRIPDQEIRDAVVHALGLERR